MRKPQRPKQSREVVLHRRRAAHVCHELQQGSPPHARKEGTVREERDPGQPGDAELGDGGLDVG